MHADPAAEHFSYPVSLDIRDLAPLGDVMEELELGPNGYATGCHLCDPSRNSWTESVSHLSAHHVNGSMTLNNMMQGLALLHGIPRREFGRLAWRAVGGGPWDRAWTGWTQLNLVAEWHQSSTDFVLRHALQGYGEEDYLIFDCPGQIELYSHVAVFRTLVEWLKAQANLTPSLLPNVYTQLYKRHSVLKCCCFAGVGCVRGVLRRLPVCV